MEHLIGVLTGVVERHAPYRQGSEYQEHQQAQGNDDDDWSFPDERDWSFPVLGSTWKVLANVIERLQTYNNDNCDFGFAHCTSQASGWLNVMLWLRNRHNS